MDGFRHPTYPVDPASHTYPYALTQQQLESHLWKAADVLRGRTVSGDCRHYIFGLLSYKRLSDVWHEEFGVRLAGYDGNRA